MWLNIAYNHLNLSRLWYYSNQLIFLHLLLFWMYSTNCRVIYNMMLYVKSYTIYMSSDENFRDCGRWYHLFNALYITNWFTFCNASDFIMCSLHVLLNFSSNQKCNPTSRISWYMFSLWIPHSRKIWTIRFYFLVIYQMVFFLWLFLQIICAIIVCLCTGIQA